MSSSLFPLWLLRVFTPTLVLRPEGLVACKSVLFFFVEALRVASSLLVRLDISGLEFSCFLHIKRGADFSIPTPFWRCTAAG